MAKRKCRSLTFRKVFGIYRAPDREGAEYAAGWTDGYEAGRRMELRPDFDGASIILVLSGTGDRRGIQKVIRHLEGVTPYPYEILIADSGADKAAEVYARRRAGAVRLIRTEPSNGAAEAVNRAVRSARSPSLVLLSCSAVPPEGWLAPILEQLRRNRRTGAVSCQFRDLETDDARASGPPGEGGASAGLPDVLRNAPLDIPPGLYSMLAFSREAWEAAGEWPGGDFAEASGRWLAKLSSAGFRPRDASGTLG